MSPTEEEPFMQHSMILSRDGSPRRRNVSAKMVTSFCDSDSKSALGPFGGVLNGLLVFIFKIFPNLEWLFSPFRINKAAAA